MHNGWRLRQKLLPGAQRGKRTKKCEVSRLRSPEFRFVSGSSFLASFRETEPTPRGGGRSAFSLTQPTISYNSTQQSALRRGLRMWLRCSFLHKTRCAECCAYNRKPERRAYGSTNKSTIREQTGGRAGLVPDRLF